MYRVEFTRQATKDLKQIPKEYIALIMNKLKTLAINPYEKNLDIKKLKGIEGAYRLRIGLYRVVYEIENKKLLITIIKVQSRGNIYG
jgi:mRNA interferase RelE/StbE